MCFVVGGHYRFNTIFFYNSGAGEYIAGINVGKMEENNSPANMHLTWDELKKHKILCDLNHRINRTKLNINSYLTDYTGLFIWMKVKYQCDGYERWFKEMALFDFRDQSVMFVLFWFALIFILLFCFVKQFDCNEYYDGWLGKMHKNNFKLVFIERLKI